MRWFDHESRMAFDDERLCRAMGAGGEKGLAIYGFYWWMVERIASANNRPSSPAISLGLRLSGREWASICHCSIRKFNSLLSPLVAAGVLLATPEDDGLFIQLNNPPGVKFISDRCPADQWAELRQAVFERDGYTCAYCGQRGGRLECDHIMPVSRGGSDHLGNLATACFTCNRSKRDKTVEEWKQ